MKAGCPLEKGGLDEMFMDVTEMVVRGNHLNDIRGHSSYHACVWSHIDRYDTASRI